MKLKNHTNEQLIERYNNLTEICKEKENCCNLAGGWAKNEYKKELEIYRNKKFAVTNVIGNRGIENLTITK